MLKNIKLKIKQTKKNATEKKSRELNAQPRERMSSPKKELLLLFLRKRKSDDDELSSFVFLYQPTKKIKNFKKLYKHSFLFLHQESSHKKK